MNSDGTAKQKPDRQSSPQSDIIDVRVVEQISSAAEQLGDVWDSGEVTDERSTSSSPPTQTQPPITIPVEPPVAQPQDVADSPPTEDNWHLLLDEIERDLEPEPEDLEPVTATEPVAADAVPLNLTSVPPSAPIEPNVLPLVRVEAEIKVEIDRLQATRAALQAQIMETQTTFGQVIQTSISELEQRRQKLQISVEQLERRRDRIKEEINKSFAGGSQDIAIRLQGFKDYLVGSLQDLVIIAEEIEFPQPPPAQIRLQAPLDRATSGNAPRQQPLAQAPPDRDSRPQTPQFAEPAFKTTATKVRTAIDRYRNAPDYYAPAWQLRRTLEAVHADKVSDWFFSKDGRGAVRTMGSRLQNILVAAAAVSALRELYGDYLRTIVLANLPERLGDWRRGFQDCLGLSKADFGGNGGIILFEDPDALVQKVDRIVANKEMPLIIIDNSENQIGLSILQYPLWLAFAPDPNLQLDDYREYR
jgi:Protein of unknown function (DUF3086)